MFATADGAVRGLLLRHSTGHPEYLSGNGRRPDRESKASRCDGSIVY